MKLLKIVGAAFCGLMTLAGIINTVSPVSSGSRVENLILTIIFLVPTVLLVRSIRKSDCARQALNTTDRKSTHVYQKNSKAVSPYLPEIPPETLRDMKKYYTAPQIQNDIHIMQESFQLVQQTTDFDTFFMRLELSQQKALTLLQAVQAGCRGIVNKGQTIKVCESVLSASQAMKTVFLDNSYKKETTSAMQLKTKSGQYKRLTAYLERLKSYEDRFLDAGDAYNQTVNALQDLIAECKPSDKKPEIHTNTRSTADEIMKFKQLLDAGAISQEEYDRKKDQLLNQ